MFYCFWLAFGAPVMWIQRGGNWVFGELSFLARVFWCSSRWMGEGHNPLPPIRAEGGHMSQGGPPATVHTARDQITSDATCQWLLWVPAGPAVTRCSRVMAVETRGDRGCWMALGFFPFRITRSLKPHSPHRPRRHIEIEKESNKILKNWVIQKKYQNYYLKLRTKVFCFILLCSFCYSVDGGSWRRWKESEIKWRSYIFSAQWDCSLHEFINLPREQMLAHSLHSLKPHLKMVHMTSQPTLQSLAKSLPTISFPTATCLICTQCVSSGTLQSVNLLGLDRVFWARLWGLGSDLCVRK